jgi:hypothetical protein
MTKAIHVENNLPALGGRGLRGGGMVRQAHHDHPEPAEGSPPPLNHARFRAWPSPNEGEGVTGLGIKCFHIAMPYAPCAMPWNYPS